MQAVLTNGFQEDSVPRAPSWLALLLSLLAHGALLALVGGDLLRAPAAVHAAVIRLTLSGPARTAPPETSVLEPAPPVQAEPVPPPPEPEPEVRQPPRKRAPSRTLRPEPVASRPPAKPVSSAEPKAAPAEVDSVKPVAATSARVADTRNRISIIPLYAPEPHYPVIARRMGLEGRVLLQVTVAPNGYPEAVEVLSGSGHDILDRAALEAVRDWRFQVRGFSGGLIAEKVEVPIRFALQ